MMGRSRDVCGMTVEHFYEIQLTDTLNLHWRGPQDFIVNDSSENFNKQYSV